MDLKLQALPPEVARNILVADYRVPRADASAGERATVGILKDLKALGYHVVFLPNDLAAAPRHEAELTRLGVEVITRERGWHTSRDYVTEKGAEFGIYYLIRMGVAESLLPTIREVAPRARVIFHAPDLSFLRETRKAELLRDGEALVQAKKTQDREIMVMRQSDHTVVVSPAEIPILKAEFPDARVSVFPALYADVAQDSPGFSERRNIFFLGGFGHSPNANAVLWFAEAIWPLVRAALPEADFYILGADVPEEIRALARVPGIQVVGYIPDLDPVLATLRVGVAPILYGAGIKGKVAVSMGAGVPCVCTEIAAEGMGIVDGVHGLIANDPRSFAEAIIALYTDTSLWNQLSRNGKALIEDRFGERSNRSSLLRVLAEAQALSLDLFCEYCQEAEPQTFPIIARDQEVQVSIIIPVSNRWERTRTCLNSVAQTCADSDLRYEVILSDDGSTDETVRATEIFPGLRVALASGNGGYFNNCNHAASFARGRYILLLHNDTIVLPGWLEALYKAMEADPSVAIVGSKLLNPDGSVQEAGAGLYANGRVIRFGQSGSINGEQVSVPRSKPIFNVLRETDCVSVVSILIRRTFWEAVGGFDVRYKANTCNGVDLAMEARARGFRVIFQPASEVMHLERQPPDEQNNASLDHLQREDLAHLLRKWKKVFRSQHLSHGSWNMVAAHGERTPPPAALNRRQEGRLNVLYFSPFPSHPSCHGNQATIQEFGRRFQALGHKVHFVLLQSGMYTPEDEQAMRKAWDTLDIVPNTRALWADGSSIPFDGWYEEGLGEAIRVICARYDIDLLFCSYIFQSKLLEYVPAYVLKVIDTHDKMGDRYEMLRKNGLELEFFSCTPEEEGAYLRRADLVLARRKEEAAYFDSVTGRSTAVVVPHLEEPNYIGKTFSELGHVGLVASANRINLAIVKEFLACLERRFADTRFTFSVHVAGRVKEMIPAEDSWLFELPWVRLHGYVPNIAEFYEAMDLIVTPVTMGTGINVKTVQAMAYGMPLLTTECGGKGIETDEPMHHHRNLEELTDSLMCLAQGPTSLQRLAEVSRTRYQSFYEESLTGFRHMFSHPKLQAAKEGPLVTINEGQDYKLVASSVIAP